MSKKTLVIGCGAVFALAACAVVALVIVVGIGGDSDTPAVADSSSSSVPVAATPIPVAPSFEEIRQNHEVMTEAQWKNYRGQIEGCQCIAWRGWVDEVTGNPGRYKVRVDMDAPDEFLSVYEVSFLVPDDVALSLQVDQPIMFTGEIDQAIDFVGSLSIDLVRVTMSVD